MQALRVCALTLVLAALAGCSGGVSEFERLCGRTDCGEGQCVVDHGGARCLCAEGAVLTDGRCVVKSACAPNPCTTAHKTVCRAGGDAYSCECEPGHVPDGDGCTADPIWTCGPHASAGADHSEPNDCPPNAASLAPGAQASSDLQPAGDQDWYRVDAVAGHVYVFAARAQVALYLDVYAADGVSAIAADHRGAANALVTFKARSTGRLFVRVRALQLNDTGAYTATLTDAGLDDFPDTPAEATDIDAGATLSGRLEYVGDVDVMRVTLAAGRNYAFQLSAPGRANVLEVLADDGATVIGHAESSDARLTVREASGGVRYVRISTNGPIGAYALQLTDVGVDDHADGIDGATPITFGSPVTGSLERAGDLDVFTFLVEDGHAYSARAQSSTVSFLRLRVYDRNRQLITSSYSNDTASWRATAGMRVYVEVASDSSYGNLGSYTLTVSDLGLDDHPDTAATADTITPDAGPVNGALETGRDVDAFAFAATAGHIYRAVATGGALLRVSVLDPSGLSIAGTSDTSVSFLAPRAGRYVLLVSSLSSYTTGPYTLTLTDQGTDDHGDTVATATALSIPKSATSAAIQYAGDRDVFSFTATAGRILRFTVVPTGSLSSVNLRLFDAGGGQLAQVGSYDVRGGFAYRYDVAGTYAIEVTGSYGIGGYTYALTDEGTDDVGDTPAAAKGITAGAPGSGTVGSYHDVDVFSFAATAGHIYRFSCNAASTFACAVRFIDGAGTTLATGDRLPASWEATRTDTAYVAVSASSSYAAQTGTYTFQLEDLGTDDFGDDVGSASPLAYDTPLAGRIESASDVDVFVLTPATGHVLNVTCTPDSTLRVCSLQLKSASGAVLATADSYSRVLAWEAPGATPVYLFVAPGYSGYAGNYTLRLSDAGKDDVGDDVASASPITLSMPTGGVFETLTDVDVFSASLLANTAYRVTVTGVYARTTIFSPAGGVMPTSGYSSQLDFATAAAGVYAVSLQADTTVQPGAHYTITLAPK